MNKRENRRLKIVTWFDALFKNKYCWVDCVSWAFSKRSNPFKIDRGCRDDKGLCYCGRFKNGVAYDELTHEQQKELKQ